MLFTLKEELQREESVAKVVNMFFLRQKVAGIRNGENSKIIMSQEFKVANCCRGRKFYLKSHLIEQKRLGKIPKIKQS